MTLATSCRRNSRRLFDPAPTISPLSEHGCSYRRGEVDPTHTSRERSNARHAGMQTLVTGKTLDGEPAGTGNSAVPVEALWGCSTQPLAHAAKRPPLERPRNVTVPMAFRQAPDAPARLTGKRIGVSDDAHRGGGSPRSFSAFWRRSCGCATAVGMRCG